MDDLQPTELSAKAMLGLLTQGSLEVHGALPYSSNYTLLASVEQGDLRALVVYKPRRGERPLWDFPRGTLCRREVAAYLVSEALGFSLVPPTVLRDGPYGIGAVQFFIESDEQAHLFTMQREPCYDEAIRRLVLFDCLINNADRKSGHCLKGADGRLWAIDHGICFHYEYKLRTVVWDYVGQPVGALELDALRGLQQRIQQRDLITEMLAEMLDQAEIRALRRRLNHLIASGTFPAPGPGPNIPWPPV